MRHSKRKIPRPEHPNPQCHRDDWMTLNGVWEFEMDPGESGQARGLHDKGGLSERILVPFCPESRLSGIAHTDFMPCVWYRRTFSLPASWWTKHILLHFGAVDYAATVWVNGHLACTHAGGFASFVEDITAYLRKGRNVLTVRAVDHTRDPTQPSGKQSMHYESHGCLYTRTTGIWQTVWLEAVAPMHIRHFRFYPDAVNGRLTIRVELSGDVSGCTLTARAFARKKPVAQETCAAQPVTFMALTVASPVLWEPGNPFLYDLDLILQKRGKECDCVHSYFGLRSIVLDGCRILINGRSVFQRLVLDQGFYPDGIYTAPNERALKKDITLSMALGFNGARLHQKVFEPRFLYWADRLGYLCWGEYPNWGLDYRHPDALQRSLPEWLQVLQRDCNHPSIVGWCPFNETAEDQNPELLRIFYQATKAMDPTRPMIDTSGFYHVITDIYDVHDYDQNPKTFRARYEPLGRGRAFQNHPDKECPYLGQPYFVSEYGGIWWNPGQRTGWGYGSRPKSPKDFLDRYRKLTHVLLEHPAISGFCYTQLTDVEQEVNGLYTYDRRLKFDPAVLHGINSKKAAIEA